MSGVTGKFRNLLSRLICFHVEEFGSGSDSEETMSLGIDRRTADLNEAHVVSSLVAEHFEQRGPMDGIPDELLNGLRLKEVLPNKHIIALDIDRPAHLIESSTPGNSHLYVEIEPVSDKTYFEFLRAAAKVGLIEHGYADVSIKRGHSDLRLPWVSKGDGPNVFVNHGDPQAPLTPAEQQVAADMSGPPPVSTHRNTQVLRDLGHDFL